MNIDKIDMVVFAICSALCVAAGTWPVKQPAPPLPLEVPPSGVVSNLTVTNYTWIDTSGTNGLVIVKNSSAGLNKMRYSYEGTTIFESSYNANCPTNFHVFSLLPPTIIATNGGWEITFE